MKRQNIVIKWKRSQKYKNDIESGFEIASIKFSVGIKSKKKENNGIHRLQLFPKYELF